MDARYVIHPGYVISTYDGDKHYLSTYDLIKCYGVSQRDCVTFIPDRFYPAEAIHLYPRGDGDYRLPMEVPALVAELHELTRCSSSDSPDYGMTQKVRAILHRHGY